ncbi:hypothetical protein [Rhodanobacter aciditrophus]|uniref:hypothetical protein n=1 Tax=Rhodanobacter aciditrophus TaxID=1623218 RepID=UPI003CE8B72A
MNRSDAGEPLDLRFHHGGEVVVSERALLLEEGTRVNNFESVVIEYLRADRSLFINTQCCIQLNPGANPDTSGPHWYCDAVAVSIKRQAAYLCEITYAHPPTSLLRRLKGWDTHWQPLRLALERDSGIPATWPLTPWLFMPQGLDVRVKAFLATLPNGPMPTPLVTHLEDVLPWRYRSWDRGVNLEDRGQIGVKFT